MTEKQEAEAGQYFAETLKFKRDKEHPDRWVTPWGTKTNLGLWRTIAGKVDEIRIDPAKVIL